MKISDVRVIVTCPGRNYVLIKILTDEGVYGVGDATLNGRELAVVAALQEHLAPLLIGRDPDRVEDAWQYLFRGAYWRGGPVLMTALAGVDMALWDIKGKVAGRPVYSLLGGRCREAVRAYTHCGGKDFREVEDRVREAMEAGFTVIRAQVAVPGCKGLYGVGGGREAALATWPGAPGGVPLPMQEEFEPGPYLRTVPALFEHLRANLGDEIDLFHDVHERLTPIQAARLAKELEPYHLFFLEDPLRPEHKESFRVVRQASVTPLAMGELFTTRWDCLPLLSEQLIDFIRCDLSHIGGITEARKIAVLAETFHVQTAWHGPGDISPVAHAANVHVDLAIPNFGVQEQVAFSEQVKEVIPGGPALERGFLNVRDVPGLGTDVNEDLAKKHPYKPAYLPVARRADGSVHDW
ncbi:MAG: D-galactonate dehydratase family protein [Planctomycetota bacterium]|nr:D-galactonate dehydratase family protein [Planctomycetota bacterium]